MASDYVSVACEHQALVDIAVHSMRALLRGRIVNVDANASITISASMRREALH
jgi:hypothetical protein